MAIRYWVGSVSADPTNTNNWSPTGAFNAGDVLYVTDSTTNATINGADMTASVEFGGLYIGAEFEGSIGTSVGSPFKIKFQATGNKVRIQGKTAGKMLWLEVAGSFAPVITVQSWGAVTAGTETTHGVHINETLAGAIGTLHVAGGDVYVEATASITNALISGGTVRCLQGAAASIATLSVIGPNATVEWGGTLGTTVTVGAGILKFTGETGPTGNVLVYGGNLQWYSDGGDIAGTLKAFSGTVDFSQATKLPVVANTEIYDSTDSTNTVFNLDNGVGGVTFTNDPDPVIGNPTFFMPPDSTLSIAG